MKLFTIANPFILLLFFFPWILRAQTVTTIAPNVSIDDALIIDAAGNIYGSNYVGSAVFKLTPDGTVSTFSGGYEAPNGLAFDDEGNLYMADNEGDRIYKILPDGSSSIFVPTIPSPSGLIKEPDSDTLIATSFLGDKLMKVTPDGMFIDWFVGGMDGPVGLAYDDDQNLYVAEYGAISGSGYRKIYKITPEGEKTEFVQMEGNGSIGFIAYANGYIYATMIYGHKIYRIDLDGNQVLWMGSNAGSTDGDASVARFNNPNGIVASATQDTLYVSDFGPKSVRMITNLEGVTSVDNIPSNYKIEVSPNPVIDQLTVTFELPKNQMVEAWLVDVNGKRIQSIQTATNLTDGLHTYTVDVAKLPKGPYFCQLIFNQKQTISKKIMIVH